MAVRRMEGRLWSASRGALERRLERETRRLEGRTDVTAAERRRVGTLARAVRAYGGREWQWRRRCRELRLAGTLADGGPVDFEALWNEPAPERLGAPEDEEAARRRAEAEYVRNLEELADRRIVLDVGPWLAPMPSDPNAPASAEALLRTLWLWTGYLTYEETLSESAQEALRRMLWEFWPRYPGGRVTRGVIEAWIRYAGDIQYERDARACYEGGRRDPRRRV